MADPVPMRKQQGGFDEKLYEDSNVEQALATLERFEGMKKMRNAPVRDARGRANERIDSDRESLNVEEAEEVYAAFVAKVQAEVEPGKSARIGPYRLAVEEYATMERVESGTGKRVKKFKRVEGEAPEPRLMLA